MGICVYALLAGGGMRCIAQNAPLERKYDVMRGPDKVGTVNASMRHADGMDHYETRSDITLQMLFKFHVNYHIKAAYKNGVLQASHATVYLNGDVRSRVDILFRGDHYDLVIDGKLRRIDVDIRCSSSTLYFERPTDGTMSFSETSGSINSIRKLADGALHLVNPQKASEKYLYRYTGASQLDEVVVDHSLLPTLHIVYRP